MAIYLHKSLCDLKKAGQLAASAAGGGTGEQRGGDYFHRIQTGYSPENKPQYRYFRTAKDWDAYSKEKKQTGKEKKTGEDSTARLKDKTEGEQDKSKQKEEKARKKDSLFIKDKKKDEKVKKSLYLKV